MEHPPSVPDLPIEIYPHILHNLDILSNPEESAKSSRESWITVNGVNGKLQRRAKEKLSMSPNFREGLIRHFDDLTIDDFIDGLGRPKKRKVDSNECISYEILGTGNYLEFEFKKQDLYQENLKDQ